MCLPAAALVVASTVLAAGGQAYQGVSANRQAQYAAGVASNNAILSRRQAADSEQRGQQEELRKWREVAQTKSAQIASYAANGFDTSFGSPTDVVADTAIFGAQDANLIRQGAAREATGFIIDANNYDAEAGAQRRAGRDALVSTAFNVGSTVLGGARQLQGMRNPTSTTVSGYGRSGWSGSSSPNSAFKF